MDVKKLKPDGWINPQGEFFSCEDYGDSRSHEISAEPLLLKFYGIESAVCGDKLIERGWIKVTTSLMFDIYKDNGLFDHMTLKQINTFNVWKEKFDM